MATPKKDATKDAAPADVPKLPSSDAVPTDTSPVPTQIVSRDELTKDTYSLEKGGQTIEVDRGHPPYIFDNQRTQQAQENSVEVQNGIRNEDGTLKENHPNYDEAAKSVKE